MDAYDFMNIMSEKSMAYMTMQGVRVEDSLGNKIDKVIFDIEKGNKIRLISDNSNKFDCYYLISTKSKLYWYSIPVYLREVNDTTMIQESIFDSTKYVSREKAEEKLEMLKGSRGIHGYEELEIVVVDRKIFGKHARNICK